MALKGRGFVRNTRRGNHLGQWSCATTYKGRTYGSKRSDQKYLQKDLQVGAVHIWTYVRDDRPWGGTAPPAAWYRFSGDSKGQHPKDHLARYRGWMHADGYAGLIGHLRPFNVLARSLQPEFPSSPFVRGLE